jgi:putative holliday junction resolvase
MPDLAVLGFDYGLRRIGVAVGQRITGTATAIAVVRNSDAGPDWSALDGLLKTWRPQALVVGLPLARDGSDQPMTHAARAFADLLQTRYALPLHFSDERFSSRAAGANFAEARRAGHARKKDAAMLDAQAARCIVEQWLNQPSPETTNT